MDFSRSHALFFDFDGVILDSLDVKSEAFYRMYQPFGEDIASKVKKFHIENGGVSRFEKFKYFHKHYLGKTLSPEELDRLCLEFSGHVTNGVIESKEVKGVWKFIERHSMKIPCFIITGTPTPEIKVIVKKLKKVHLFEQIVGSPRNKEFWVPFLVTKYNYSNNQIWFFGDAPSDYKAAKNNKLNFVLRSHADNKDLQRKYAGPTFETFKDLL